MRKPSGGQSAVCGVVGQTSELPGLLLKRDDLHASTMVLSCTLLLLSCAVLGKWLDFTHASASFSVAEDDTR